MNEIESREEESLSSLEEHINLEKIEDHRIYFLTRVLNSSERYLCHYEGKEPLKRGTRVVVPSRYGKDLAEILGPVSKNQIHEDKEIHPITRIASEGDLNRYNENKEREKEAMRICQEKILAHKLEMKLVATHYLLDESKVLFFFTAESRVDFRELVRDLVSVFRMRIELRQIGVRDESRVLGGLAVCGRPYCCHDLTDKLKPVSIKMAKEQNLSLNSMKISGPCGRLLCCLSYEYDFYREEKRKYPQPGSRIEYDGATFRIQEVNILSKILRMSGSDGRVLELPLSNFYFDEKKKFWQFIGTDEEG